MNDRELQNRAIAVVTAALAEGGPPEPRVVPGEQMIDWHERLLRRVSDHELTVLGRGPDIVVFFDEAGREVGWRDDGRRGTEHSRPIVADLLRDAIVAELELAPSTRLISARSVELPPVGWTHEALLTQADPPTPATLVRAWADPRSLKVIQCLTGASAEQRS